MKKRMISPRKGNLGVSAGAGFSLRVTRSMSQALTGIWQTLLISAGGALLQTSSRYSEVKGLRLRSHKTLLCACLACLLACLLGSLVLLARLVCLTFSLCVLALFACLFACPACFLCVPCSACFAPSTNMLRIAQGPYASGRKSGGFPCLYALGLMANSEKLVLDLNHFD